MSAASAAADEERRKAEKPLCTPDEARELAAAAFGITDIVAVKELESYDDRNFRIKGRLGVGAAAAEATSEETYFTLKVHNGVESDSPSSLDAQDAAMLYLHEKGLRVPYPVRPRQHAQIFVAGVDGHKVEKQLVVRLLSWVDGETMNETGCDAGMLAEAGRYVRERGARDGCAASLRGKRPANQ